MADGRLTDEQLLDYLLEMLYQDNHYSILSDYTAVAVLGDNLNVHHKDGERIWRKLVNEGIITPDKQGHGLYSLSDKGMWLMRKFGSYSKYTNEGKEAIKKKEKIERNDRVVKNIGILATLGVSLLTLFLTQCPSKKEQAQEKTTEGIQSVEKKLDSLLHVLPQSQPTQGK